MKIKFDVTQEDINEGCTIDIYNCMVARCLQRVLGYKKINTISEFCDIRVGINNYRFMHSIKTEKKILAFDRGEKVKPFSFSFDIPDSVLEQIGYFDRKGDKYVESFVSITAKENNIEENSKQQRRTIILEKETDRKNLIHA